MFSKELFGQRIQEIRKLHNETQKELGAIMGTRPNNEIGRASCRERVSA